MNSSSDKVELSEICRLCLMHGCTLLNINSHGLKQKLWNFLKISMFNSPALSSSICEECLQKVESFSVFYDLVQKNQKQLHGLDSGIDNDCILIKQERKVVIEPELLIRIDEYLQNDEIEWSDPEDNILTDEEVEEEQDVCHEEEFVNEEIPWDQEEEQEPLPKVQEGNIVKPVIELTDLIGQKIVVKCPNFLLKNPKPLDPVEISNLPKLKLVQSEHNTNMKRKQNELEEIELPQQTKRTSTRVNSKRTKLDDKNLEDENELIRNTVLLNCHYCNQELRTLEQVISHISAKHDDLKGYVECCGRRFRKRPDLLEHVNLHINPKAFTCTTCNKTFTRKRHLQVHSILHLPEEERQYPCDLCNKRYPTKYRLTLHKQTHSETANYFCTVCGKGFRLKMVLNQHIKAVHEMSQSKVCELCARIFKTKEGYEMHKRQHLEKQPPKIQCEYCGKKCKNKDSIKYHLLRHRREDERYYCDISTCKKEFRCKRQLRSHKKHVHGDKNLKCTHCDKTFSRALNLKEHIATHTGEILYKCQFCSKPFFSSANRYSHLKYYHEKEWRNEQLKKSEN